MPLAKARLHELFGPQRVHVSERSASLISEGAACSAGDVMNTGLRASFSSLTHQITHQFINDVVKRYEVAMG